MNLIDLEKKMEEYERSAERIRYSKQDRPCRPRKSSPWRIEQIIVPREVWMHFADEGCKQYAGGHGSRRLHVVYYNGEEVGKFPTQLRAKEFIWDKERT